MVSALRECTRLLALERYRDAANRCETAFEETKAPRAGLAAARAAIALGDDLAVSRWERDLHETSAEAELLEETAVFFLDRGDVDGASERLRRVAAIGEATSDHARVARAHGELLFLAWSSSSYREALSHAAISYEASTAAEDADLEAQALLGLFTVLYETGDLDSALNVLQRAIALVPEEDHQAHASLLLNRAAVFMDQGRFSLGHGALERALELSSGVGSDTFFRSAYLNLANVYLNAGDVEAAQESLERAERYVEPGRAYLSLHYNRAKVQLVQEAFADARRSLESAMKLEPGPEWAWRLETEIGQAEERLGNTGSAEEAYLRAMDAIEGMRASLALDDMKSWLLEQKRKPYESLFRLRAENGDSAGALEVLERAKARTFLDALVRTTLEPPATGQILPYAAKNRFEALERLIPRMEASGVTSLKRARELIDALTGYDVLLYFVAGDRVWLTRVSEGRVDSHALPAGRGQIEDEARGFASHPDDDVRASELGGLLLPPDMLPPGGGALHIVTDSFLGRVPFAALIVEGRRLVEAYTLSFVPSLNAMFAMTAPSVQPGSPPVVLGASEDELSGAAREAEAVASQLDVEPHIGSAATIPAFRQASDARLLHLALHTGLDHRGPWIQLSDGVVTSDVVLREKIGPPLVVLASCASAARDGKDLWGSLSAAFLASGSRSVIASLRSIEDEPTRQLIERFYQLGGATDPASALARAQRAFIAEGAATASWSPFVHLGPTR